MYQPIYNPGFRFTLFKLQGSLRYTLTRPGKAPKVYDICDSDLDDESSSESSGSEETDKLKPGLDASAVGIQLRLIQNDGILNVEFEGRDGASANWTFDGLELVDGGKVVATAATQTEFHLKTCVLCVQEKRDAAEVKHTEAQTDTAATQSSGVQTGTLTTSSTGVQTATNPRVKIGSQIKAPLHRQFPQTVEILGPFIDDHAPKKLVKRGLNNLVEQLRSARKILDKIPTARSHYHVLVLELKKQEIRKSTALHTAQGSPAPIKVPATSTSGKVRDVGQVSVDQKASAEDTTTTNPDLKRKASPMPESREPLHKRAKSTHDSLPWPRHIYMECFRNTPIFKGDVGVLHIDVEAGSVWFEGWYGREHMRVQERKQVDLRDPTTRISFEKLLRPGTDKATHELAIGRLNAQFNTTTLLHADCCAPGWQIWGLDTAHYAFGKPAAKDMIPIADPLVVVDALVHCIDVTSRREAVHDPDTEHKLAQEVKECTAAQKSGQLSGQKTTDWEWTVRELGNREKLRKRLRVVDGEGVEENEMREIKEVSGAGTISVPA